ncbi:MAG: hypothetical protein A3F72_17200 [Bacteroidetes bacterium RIFCSPLOWO2_12_FULL_35_15]|nr:MAG: hypothetical protein A3F72_17200 [Bacteroidetes bacterium RIFCSPLOWO2_12_FULL_35_15]
MITPIKFVFNEFSNRAIALAEFMMMLLSELEVPSKPALPAVTKIESAKKIRKKIYTEGLLNQSFNSKRKICLNIILVLRYEY